MKMLPSQLFFRKPHKAVDFNPHIDKSVEPVDIGLTAAVHAFCERFMPEGYDLTDNACEAPKSLFDIEVMMMSGDRRMVAWTGHSDNNIYGTPEDNAAFRAWHDYTHFAHHLPFNLAGEAGCAYVQCQHILSTYGDDRETRAWCAMILAEIIGQVIYNITNEGFPTNQREFTMQQADVFVGMADRLAVRLTGANNTPQFALYMAELAFGRAV